MFDYRGLSEGGGFAIKFSLVVLVLVGWGLFELGAYLAS